MSLEDIFKTSSRSLDQDQYISFGHTSSRPFQGVFKTSGNNVLKTSLRHLAHTLSRRIKSPSRCLGKMSLRNCQDAFMTYYQVKPFFLTRLQRFLWDVLERRLSTERLVQVTLLRNLWLGYKISKSELFDYSETFETVLNTLYEVIASVQIYESWTN